MEDQSSGCSRQVLRWQLIGIFDAITELMIVMLSCGLVWRLQMRLELKLRVILAFMFRLPLIPVAIVHVFFVRRTPAINLSLAIIPSITCEQVELGYSLLSATIPNLKSFIMSFDTAMMMDVSYKLQSYALSANTAGQRSVRLGSSSTRAPRISDVESRDEFIGRLRPADEGLEYTSTIRHLHKWTHPQAHSSESLPTADSQDRSIRRDVHWRVEETFANV